ncbi:MAG: NifB/NifX family molybdenum-iron cluster-binding protein [Thermodesulforhabdaceae bacterium]
MKILVTLSGQEIAPRFDLTTEVLIAICSKQGEIEDAKVIVLPQASADDLCHFIVKEKVDVVICGAIEEEYFQYLVWKKIKVFDSVIGMATEAIQHFAKGTLTPGKLLA